MKAVAVTLALLLGGVVAPLLSVATPVSAADPAMPAGDATKAYEAAMQRMHHDMMIPYTGDVDVDFVRGMIPHHQGAIDQAEVLLKYSKNPRLRRLAGGIIAAQKREIRFMKRWLDEHDRGLSPGELPDRLRSAPSTAEEAEKADEKAAQGDH